jgi:hypothetical protein
MILKLYPFLDTLIALGVVAEQYPKHIIPRAGFFYWVPLFFSDKIPFHRSFANHLTASPLP